MSAITSVERRVFAVILLLAGLLPIPAAVLLTQVGWPNSLQGMPFAEALPLVNANPFAFRFGYGAMVISGVLFIPAAVYLLRVIAGAGEPSLLLRVAGAFAISGGALRSLWYAVVLTGVPVLERLSTDADAATRAAINVFYVAINDTMSTIQEDIGVNLFIGTFLVIVAIATWRTQAFPRWTAAMGGLGGLSFIISSSELIGISNRPIIPLIGPIVSSLWIVALGFIELARASRIPAPQTGSGQAAAGA